MGGRRSGAGRLLLGILVFVLAATARAASPTPAQLASLQLPANFSVSTYTGDVPGARSLCFSKDTSAAVILYVTTRGSSVYAVVDANKDGVPERVDIVASGLNQPNGCAWRNGSLYIAEIQRIWVVDNADSLVLARANLLSSARIFRDGFPSDAHHGWRYIAWGPDDKLYMPIGMPCNVCEQPPPYGEFLRISSDGAQVETYARGTRNSVGFDWHPTTGALFFTDNGRDGMGDNYPDCELNFAPTPGLNFGFPYCQCAGGGDPVHRDATPLAPIPDPNFNPDGSVHACSAFQTCVGAMGPHVAPLGMKFYSGASFPAQYRQVVFVAEHGSWDRTERIGYRVAAVTVDGSNGRVLSDEVFASGWLQPNGVMWGRPVDVAVHPLDGSLLVSDDYKGAVYRIRYSASPPPPTEPALGPQPPPTNPPPPPPMAQASPPPGQSSPPPNAATSIWLRNALLIPWLVAGSYLLLS
eukprot:jgi/Mesvir1/28770/Mv19735-RA.1